MLHHFRTVAESTGVPVMLYDVPGRTGTQIALETYAAAKEWDTVVAVKDAVGDYARGVKIMQMGYDLYSGDDVSTLGWLAHGAQGVVSVVGHAAGDEIAGMIRDFLGGDHAAALATYTPTAARHRRGDGRRPTTAPRPQRRACSCSASSTTATSAALSCRCPTRRWPPSVRAWSPPA